MLPGRYINVRNCVEVFQQVVFLDVGPSQSRAEESQAEVGEGEEVSQTLHGLHPGVQGVHVDQFRTCKHPKPGAHLEHHDLLFLLVKHLQSFNMLFSHWSGRVHLSYLLNTSLLFSLII